VDKEHIENIGGQRAINWERPGLRMDMVTHACVPSYSGDRGRRIKVKSVTPYLKKKLKPKGLEV
jgi:hypothetical protein